MKWVIAVLLIECFPALKHEIGIVVRKLKRKPIPCFYVKSRRFAALENAGKIALFIWGVAMFLWR